METVSEALAAAFAHHEAGRLDAACDLYRQILALEPAHAEAWHLLGVANFQRGKLLARGRLHPLRDRVERRRRLLSQ